MHSDDPMIARVPVPPTVSIRRRVAKSQLRLSGSSKGGSLIGGVRLVGTREG